MALGRHCAASAIDPGTASTSPRDTGSNEEGAIRPGDRIWAHGKLRRRDGELTMRGFSAWLDSSEPADRVRNAMEYVKFGALAVGSGLVLMLFGWLIGVVI